MEYRQLKLDFVLCHKILHLSPDIPFSQLLQTAHQKVLNQNSGPNVIHFCVVRIRYMLP